MVEYIILKKNKKLFETIKIGSLITFFVGDSECYSFVVKNIKVFNEGGVQSWTFFDEHESIEVFYQIVNIIKFCTLSVNVKNKFMESIEFIVVQN